MASSTSLQVAGLASNFDWKSFTDQIMALEHKPADNLAAEQATNDQKSNMFSILGTKLTALQVATENLKADGVFGKRTASSSSTWYPTADIGTAAGTYKIAVSQLATAAKVTGVGDVGSALNPNADSVAGLTVATLPIATGITAGTFTVNGKQVNVALTDSLDSVFSAISTATGGDVTASYDHTTDKISLTSASGNLTLGAANDTSNFFRALKLTNTGTGTSTSTDKLGSVKLNAALANANLSTALTATGASSFKVNGVSIAYDVTTDTISSIMKKITASSAGVTASYDAANDRFSLANTGTGDLGISVSDDAGGLLASMGLMTGSTFTRGQNAQFTVNDGPTQWSASNTLDAASHGIAGLGVRVDSTGTQTVTVAVDTSSMQAKIQSFIDKFNDVQDYLDTSTKITADGKGKVTAAALSGNREIQAWSSSLRNLAFSALSGSGTGSIKRMEDLGIDFTSGTSKLEIKDSSKLSAALTNKSGDVESFFHTDSTGFAARLDTFVTGIISANTDQQTRLTKANASLDDQIAAIERRLAQEREVMESAFINMETAQSKLKSQGTILTNSFSSSSSSK